MPAATRARPPHRDCAVRPRPPSPSPASSRCSSPAAGKAAPAGAEARARACALAAAEVLARAVGAIDGDAEQPVGRGDAVEKGGVQRAATIDLGEEPRVVEQALVDLRLGLGAGGLVGPRSRGDGLAQRDRLLAQQHQQVASRRRVVEAADRQQTHGSQRARDEDPGGSQRCGHFPKDTTARSPGSARLTPDAILTVESGGGQVPRSPRSLPPGRPRLVHGVVRRADRAAGARLAGDRARRVRRSSCRPPAAARRSRPSSGRSTG